MSKCTEVRSEYHEHGYTVFVNDEPNYCAGNSPYDSQTIEHSAFGLPLKTLRKYSVQTGKEIAEELRGKFIGTERISSRGKESQQ